MSVGPSVGPEQVIHEPPMSSAPWRRGRDDGDQTAIDSEVRKIEAVQCEPVAVGNDTRAGWHEVSAKAVLNDCSGGADLDPDSRSGEDKQHKEDAGSDDGYLDVAEHSPDTDDRRWANHGEQTLDGENAPDAPAVSPDVALTAAYAGSRHRLVSSRRPKRPTRLPATVCPSIRFYPTCYMTAGPARTD